MDMQNLYFVRQGRGPLVVLSHALGCDLTMWDGVANALQDRYTVLRYDHRGHGQSSASGTAFTIDDLADDVANLIQAHSLQPVHFVGLSMGGMTAQALGARYPALVRSLVIANSASRYDETARAMWNTRISTVLQQGMQAVVGAALQRWFTPEFRSDTGRGKASVAALRAVLEKTAPGPYAAACEAVANIALDAGNARISSPTLVIAGARDEATPPAMASAIANGIAGAQLRNLDAAHLSAVEQPEAFTRLLTEFWVDL